MATLYDYFNGFWLMHEQEPFSTSEISMYMYMLSVANKFGWQESFQRSNKKMMSDLDMAANTFKKARDGLADRKMIQFGFVDDNPRVVIYQFLTSNFPQYLNFSSEIVSTPQSDLVSKIDKYNKTKTKTKIKEKTPSYEGEEKKASLPHPPPSCFASFWEWMANKVPYCYGHLALATDDELKELTDRWGMENVQELLLALENNGIWRSKVKVMYTTIRNGLEADEAKGLLKHGKPMRASEGEPQNTKTSGKAEGTVVGTVAKPDDEGLSQFLAVLIRDAKHGKAEAENILSEMGVTWK